MADEQPAARSPLAHLVAAAEDEPRAPPVALCEIALLGMINLRLDPADEAARQAAEAALGVPLPLEPNRSAAREDRIAMWLGPDEFLIVTASGAEAAL
ncbi:MAG: sarcosine oxidase subunit gamma, partial [Alphaproteobacteria bacterium]|nr:sarcosine oxidase subunit gamma [Alphaproteobacteria bacterium]